MPRSAMDGSYAKPIFSFKRNWRTIFQCGCTTLPAQPWYIRVPVWLQPHQHLLSSVVLIREKWYITVVLITIFPMTNYVQHLFVWLLALCVFSLEQYLFKSFIRFKIVGFVFLLLNLRVLITIPDQFPFSDFWFANIFFLWVVFSLSWWEMGQREPSLLDCPCLNF